MNYKPLSSSSDLMLTKSSSEASLKLLPESTRVSDTLLVKLSLLPEIFITKKKITDFHDLLFLLLYQFGASGLFLNLQWAFFVVYNSISFIFVGLDFCRTFRWFSREILLIVTYKLFEKNTII